MIKIQGKLLRSLFLACSGGSDSMAALSFLRNNHDITVAFFNHGNEFDEFSEQWMRDYCNREQLKFVTARITREKHKQESVEEYWRNERYQWLHSLPGEVVTVHHLDDCVETWVWSSMHGEGRLIGYRKQNVIRPFRLNEKAELLNWVVRKKVEYIEDPGNQNQNFMRNYIRHSVMPHILKINPGIKKTIIKKLTQEPAA
jgi:tRNA(Ile)-lysidine synthase